MVWSNQAVQEELILPSDATLPPVGNTEPIFYIGSNLPALLVAAGITSALVWYPEASIGIATGIEYYYIGWNERQTSPGSFVTYESHGYSHNGLLQETQSNLREYNTSGVPYTANDFFQVSADTVNLYPVNPQAESSTLVISPRMSTMRLRNALLLDGAALTARIPNAPYTADVTGLVDAWQPYFTSSGSAGGTSWTMEAEAYVSLDRIVRLSGRFTFAASPTTQNISTPNVIPIGYRSDAGPDSAFTVSTNVWGNGNWLLAAGARAVAPVFCNNGGAIGIRGALSSPGSTAFEFTIVYPVPKT